MLQRTYLDELEHAAADGLRRHLRQRASRRTGTGSCRRPTSSLPCSPAPRTTPRSSCSGNSIALYNPPVRVAEEFAMLDCISGGRLVAGFPVGTPMDTVYCYGQNPATLREKYHEAHDLIMRAWTEPEPFAFDGDYTQLRYVNIWPRPSSSRTRRCGSPVAGRSRRGSGPRSSTTSTATCRTSAGRGGQRTMEGLLATRSNVWATTTTPTAPASCSSSAWPTPMPKRTVSTANRPSTSTTAVST